MMVHRQRMFIRNRQNTDSSEIGEKYKEVTAISTQQFKKQTLKDSVEITTVRNMALLDLEYVVENRKKNKCRCRIKKIKSISMRKYCNSWLFYVFKFLKFF